jgi:hypothetical protein
MIGALGMTAFYPYDVRLKTYAINVVIPTEGTPFARRGIETIVNKTGKALRLTTYASRLTP